MPPALDQTRLRPHRSNDGEDLRNRPFLGRKAALYAFRVATHAQGWLPAGWLAFTGRESNPLDHSERFQIVRSSSSPVLLTLLKLIWYAVARLFRSRPALQTEVLAFRHPLNVLR
jgi:hypothetical protein